MTQVRERGRAEGDDDDGAIAPDDEAGEQAGGSRRGDVGCFGLRREEPAGRAADRTTPNIVATEQRSGDTTLFGGDKGTAVRIDRISSIQSDNVVSAAAVTRNPEAAKRPFILDPLLN